MGDLVIYILSDSLGETAEGVARAAASQYKGYHIQYRKIPYVHDEKQLLEIVSKINPENSILVYTLVMQGMGEQLQQYACSVGLIAIDILKPMLDVLSISTGLRPSGKPGKNLSLDDQYFRKIDAIEFAVKYDDGQDARGFLEADLVLIGVSRTSKTPLCMYLAHKGIKAANLPLVPEIPICREVYQVPKERIIGLVIDSDALAEIRTERLKFLGLENNANYGNYKRIQQELRFSRMIMDQLKCKILDVSHKAIEETAGEILHYYYQLTHSEL